MAVGKSGSAFLASRASRNRALHRIILLIIGAVFLILLWPKNYQSRGGLVSTFRASDGSSADDKLPAQTRHLATLTREQCIATFPDIRVEIEKAVKHAESVGGIELRRVSRVVQGMVEGRIKDGKLFIIRVADDVSEQMFHHRLAAISQLHRAIVSAPEPIPDMVFKLTVDDDPKANTWSLSRCDDNSCVEGVWTIPHSAYWAWPTARIDAMDEVVEEIINQERSRSWDQKIDLAIWRGTVGFSPLYNRELRSQLIRAADEKPWADVETLDRSVEAPKTVNWLTIDDFCKYRYIIYAEGFTYSGRMPYHQACESVIITTPVVFTQHNTHLMRPLFSYSLPLNPDAAQLIPPPTKTTVPPRRAYSLPNLHRTWPLSYPVESANVIFVAPDWSDLDAVMKYLQDNPEVGRTIARNQRLAVREAGYLSTAAETCYWRELMHEWSKVYIAAEEPEYVPDAKKLKGINPSIGWGRLVGDEGTVNKTVLGERFETWLAKQVKYRREETSTIGRNL